LENQIDISGKEGAVSGQEEGRGAERQRGSTEEGRGCRRVLRRVAQSFEKGGAEF